MRKKLIILSVLYAFLFSCLPAPVPAFVWTVDGVRTRTTPTIDVTAYGLSETKTGAENLAAWVAALGAVPDNGAVLLFPPGHYAIDNGAYAESAPRLSGKSNVSIVGDGATLTFTDNTSFVRLDNCWSVSVSGFNFSGSLSDNVAYTGIANQGRVFVWGGGDVKIHHNTFSNTPQALFTSGAKGVYFDQNYSYRQTAPVQGGSLGNYSAFVTGNYFEGHTYSASTKGSDDTIAFFSGPTSSIVISGNVIDKKGPTANNQARCINITPGTASTALGSVTITGNSFLNQAGTDNTYLRYAVVINGNATVTATNLSITGNVFDNCVGGVAMEVASRNATISGNVFRNMINVTGTTIESGDAVVIVNTPKVENLVLANNVVDNCYRGFSLSNMFRGIISGNIVRGAASTGILLSSSDNVSLVGNIIDGATSYGVQVSTGNGIMLHGNKANSGGSYGLRIQGTTSSGISIGNNWDNNTSGGVNNIATSSIWRMLEDSTGTKGISGTGIPAKNLRGQVTFASAGTAAVSFTDNEASTAYFVALGCDTNAEHFTWASKAVNGFTITSSNASSTAKCDWILIR